MQESASIPAPPPLQDPKQELDGLVTRFGLLLEADWVDLRAVLFGEEWGEEGSKRTLLGKPPRVSLGVF